MGEKVRKCHKKDCGYIAILFHPHDQRPCFSAEGSNLSQDAFCTPVPRRRTARRLRLVNHLALHVFNGKVRKSHQLQEMSALMDELAPSLKAAARGGVSKGREVDSDSDSTDSASGESVEGDTIVGRCTAAALATGIDCVLDEEFSASRESARITGFSEVRRSREFGPVEVATAMINSTPVGNSLNMS